MDSTSNKWLSRKFFLATMFSLLGLILLFLGKISPKELTDLLQAIMALYTIGNVVEKFAPPQVVNSAQKTTPTDVSVNVVSGAKV